MAVEVEEARPRFETPDFDEVIHGAGHAAIAVVVKDDAVHFLRVSLQAVDEFAGGDAPDAHGGVVGAANHGVAEGCDGADGVHVPLESADEVGVFGLVLGRTGLLDAGFAQAGEAPDAAG